MGVHKLAGHNISERVQNMARRKDKTTAQESANDSGSRDGISGTSGKEGPADLAGSHFRYGWLMLLVFLTLGIVLEGLHGFKSQWYLSVANETRRLMLTLGHAHGTLFGLINLGFAATCAAGYFGANRPRARLAGGLLKISSILMPAGFILGGIRIYGGDPGLGIILVPVGAILMLAAVAIICLDVRKSSGGNS